MERVNPVEKKFFNYDAYCALLTALGEADKKGDADAAADIHAVKKAFQSFHDYVCNVDMCETQIKIAYARFEGNDLREAVERYDTVRRSFHEGAIANTSLVNAIAKAYGVEKIFLGDNTDRYQVADFCLDATVIIFENRKA